jgi:hypothetical protein
MTDPTRRPFDGLAPRDQLFSALSVHQNSRSPVSVGERVAAAVASLTSAELLKAQTELGDDDMGQLVDLLEDTRKCLAGRLELVDNALLRLASCALDDNDAQ